MYSVFWIDAGVISSLKKNKITAINTEKAKAGSEILYRLIPFDFMAVISLYLEKEPYVINVAKSTADGKVKEILIGIEKKEYEIICSMVALLLKNMRALLKKSIMRYRSIKVMVIIANNLLNS